MRLLSNLLSKFIKNGKLRLYDHTGKLHEFGEDGGEVTVTGRISDPSLYWKIFINPELHAAEGYMDEKLNFEEGSTYYDLLYLFSINRAGLQSHAVQGAVRRFWKAVRRRQQSNDVKKAHVNARHHYDLSIDMYRLFLDEDLNYTCAYFRTPDDTIQQAQEAKLNHALSKLRLEPGMRVLEIGGGWGSFAIKIAQAGARVVSLNLSPEQAAITKDYVEKAGVSDRVEFVIEDYREYKGSFDRVVSVGMMEHVGIGHLDEFFGAVRNFLTEDGYAFIHSVGRMSPPGTTGPFYRKYIFPGGYVPALSETYAAIERQGLWTLDMEILRLHYYYTLKRWRTAFTERRDEAKAIYDERFCRMWEFYLAAAELGFLHGSNMVFQVLLSKKRDAVPIIRDWMFEDEQTILAGNGPGTGA